MSALFRPARLQTIGLLGPGLISLFMGLWALVMPLRGAGLAGVLSVQCALLASVAATVAAASSHRAQLWRLRQAPAAAWQRQVFKFWRARLVWALVLCLFGSVAMALRLLVHGSVAPAVWTLSLPLLGVALGSFAGWAWHGFASQRWFIVVPVVPLFVIGVNWAWPLLEKQISHAAACAVLATGLMYGVLRHASALRMVWRRLGPDAELRRAKAAAKLPPRRWAVLAPDGESGQGVNSRWPAYGRMLNMGAMTVLIGHRASGCFEFNGVLDTGKTWGYAACMAWFGIMISSHIVFRASHWRLRLAPGMPNTSRQVMAMVAGTAALWMGIVGAGWVVLVLDASGKTRDALHGAAGLLTLDMLLAVAGSVWLRSVWNREPRVLFRCWGWSPSSAAPARCSA